MADRTVRYRLQADIGQFKAQMAQAGAATRKAAADMTSMEKSAIRQRQGLATLGSAAGKVGLVAAAGFGAAVVKAADFDASMSQVQAATGEAAAGMDKLREAALEAGARTAFSASEASAGITELAKAGISTQDILGGGLNGALDLAAAGQIEVGEAAEYAAKAMTQFSLDGAQVPHIADLLAAAAGKAVGEVGDFGQALNQVGLVASQTGLTIEDTVGTLAAFSQAGLSGSDAGTAFKSMLQRLQNPLGQGAKAMEQFGINAYDTQGNFVGITEVAGQLQEKFQGVDQATRDAAFAQIFGSDAVRAASVLYREGAGGIQSWIDQTNDSGFAAEQAATKLDNLKGDLEALGGSLETALIGTGSGSQGVLRNLTQGLTSVINKYNELPPAAQTATGAVLAGTAAVGGSIWVGSKLIQGIANTRDALDSIPGASDKASRGLRGLAKAGAALAVFEIGILAIKGLTSALEESLPGTEQLTGQLLDLNSGAIGGLSGEFDSLSDSIGRITDENRLEHAGDSLLSLLSLGQLEGRRLTEARNEITALDAALANMATSAGPQAAADALANLARTEGISADALSRLKTLLPQYDEAVASAGNQAKLAAAEQGALAGSTDRAGRAAQRQAAAAQKQAAALAESRKAARETASAFVSIGNAIEGGKQSLGSFLRNLEQQAEALQNFQNNAEKAGKKGLEQGLIEDLRKLGPEGARQMGQLANATDSEIKRANKAWRAGQAEINRYTDAVGGVPNSVSTDVNINTGNAISELSSVDRWLNLLDGKTATTYVETIRRGSRHVPGLQMATGGELHGPGTATSDSIPLWGSDGEFMMKAAAVDHYGPDFMHAVNSLRYAEGGMVGAAPGSPRVTVGSPNVSSDIRVFIGEREIHDVAIRAANRVVNAQQSHDDLMREPR